MTETVFEIRNLKVAFPSPRGVIRAVEGVSLSMRPGECLALVGESGCGKSVTSLAALKLLDPSLAVVRTDVHRLCGKDIRGYDDSRMADIRGKEASMIFQDALSALNPVVSVGRQIDEIYLRHMKLKKAEAKRRSIEALAQVGVPDPASRYRSFPHELSGGMRQRVLIAMAFACSPQVILADEPTTALDVTIQAQVLDVLSRMQREHRTALLLISHDFSVVYHMADRIAVMYSGKIVEEAPRSALFAHPMHPYTRGLLASVVQIGDGQPDCAADRDPLPEQSGLRQAKQPPSDRKRFVQIPGSLPDPVQKTTGCYYHPRCPYASARCREIMPVLAEREPGHFVRCHLSGEAAETGRQ